MLTLKEYAKREGITPEAARWRVVKGQVAGYKEPHKTHHNGGRGYRWIVGAKPNGGEPMLHLTRKQYERLVEYVIGEGLTARQAQALLTAVAHD